MGLIDPSSPWPYWGVLVAAMVEGEVTYIAAAALVAHGALRPLPVVLAGSIGAAVGDQVFFYVFHGRMARWLNRYPSLEQKTAPLLDRVRRHSSLMVLLIRFAPGLRIAIAAACALVDVPPLRFSLLNLLSSVVWAVALLVIVSWFGPSLLAQYGLGGWKGALLAGVGVFMLFKLLGKYEQRAMNHARPRQ
jgi:undecaprenyl-diphosphatase